MAGHGPRREPGWLRAMWLAWAFLGVPALMGWEFHGGAVIFVPLVVVMVGGLLGSLWTGARAARVSVRAYRRTGARLNRGHAPVSPTERAVAWTVLTREESTPRGPWARWGFPALFLFCALVNVPDRNWAFLALMLGNVLLFTTAGLLAPRRTTWCAWLRRELKGAAGDGRAAAERPGGATKEPG
ncbi:hypothetical protein [Streptomyces sp. NPDC088923]|uniref:hypothetical protein n=1 Tax=Streptomyces sp. NPDC088923 TaxID=3365913 RepID=UPI00381371BA